MSQLDALNKKAAGSAPAALYVVPIRNSGTLISRSNRFSGTGGSPAVAGWSNFVTDFNQHFRVAPFIKDVVNQCGLY